MMTADYCTSEASPQCTLDLRVYEDDTTPIGMRQHSQFLCTSQPLQKICTKEAKLSTILVVFISKLVGIR